MTIIDTHYNARPGVIKCTSRSSQRPLGAAKI